MKNLPNKEKLAAFVESQPVRTLLEQLDYESLDILNLMREIQNIGYMAKEGYEVEKVVKDTTFVVKEKNLAVAAKCFESLLDFRLSLDLMTMTLEANRQTTSAFNFNVVYEKEEALDLT